jgi:alkanesulfonate monooxygenase SsuD/methylene tetrahydromethanopterin reductase-like flavin-dependent oxidoreductase (luciferase family)
MWIGASADPAIRRAARLADAWVMSPGCTPAWVEEKLRLYREALQAQGREDQVSEVIMRRDIHLSASREQARREASDLFARGYRGFDAEAMEASLIVDDPEGCIRYLEGMRRLGITHILFRCAMRDQAAALQTIRLIGTEVIPHLKAP